MRWVPRRKAALLQQIDDGAITLEEACARHDLSPEEVTSWRTAIAQHGIAGLRVTRLQAYRETGPHRRVIKMAAAIAFLALAGAAQAQSSALQDLGAGGITDPDYCHNKPIGQLTGDQNTWCSAMTHFRGVLEAAREESYARMPPAHRQCYEAADQTHLEGGSDDSPRMQFVRVCIAKAAAAAAAPRATRQGPREIPLAHAPKEIPLR